MQIPDDLIRRNVDSLLSVRGPGSANSESREDVVRKDLTLRLKGICNQLSKKEFDVLVSDMTREQLRGECMPGRRNRPS
jgi:hypothetical protein